MIDKIAASVADALAPGFIRRMVAGVVLALLTLWLSLRPPTPASAATAPSAVERVVDRSASTAGSSADGNAPPAVAHDGSGGLRLVTPAEQAVLAGAGIRHAVVRGDNLVDLDLLSAPDGDEGLDLDLGKVAAASAEAEATGENAALEFDLGDGSLSFSTTQEISGLLGRAERSVRRLRERVRRQLERLQSEGGL